MKIRDDNRTKIINQLLNSRNWNQQFVFIKAASNVSPSWFGLPILISEKFVNCKNKFLKYLNQKGIETRPVFYPIHKMKIYRTHKKNDMNNTEYISKNGISLPSYPQLEKKEILYVCKKIKDFFNKIYA